MILFCLDDEVELVPLLKNSPFYGKKGKVVSIVINQGYNIGVMFPNVNAIMYFGDHELDHWNKTGIEIEENKIPGYCNHEYKKYVGFTEVYTYCIYCDDKRDV